MANKKCAHPGCNCQAADGSSYCGAWCEGAAGTPEVTCNCGHVPCEVVTHVQT